MASAADRFGFDDSAAAVAGVGGDYIGWAQSEGLSQNQNGQKKKLITWYWYQVRGHVIIHPVQVLHTSCDLMAHHRPIRI